MKKCAIIISLLIAILVTSSQAHAATILDTGTPPDDSVLGYFESGKGYATEFSLSQPHYLTTVEGHMSGYRWNYDDERWPQASGTATAIIYGDGGDIPNVGSELFSQQFYIPAATGWYGVSGVNWALPVGDYWLAFEVRSGDTYGGAMDYPAPNAIFNEALITNYGTYSANDNLNFGMRAYGTPYDQGVIPEPSSMLLLGMGLLGAGFFRRKKKA